MAVPPELLGPSGLLIGALILIVILGRDHFRADAEDRRQRDELRGLVDASIEAVNRLSAALEERNRRDADTRRRSDE